MSTARPHWSAVPQPSEDHPMSSPPSADSDARDLHVALMQAHQEHVRSEADWSEAVLADRPSEDEANDLRDAAYGAAARVSELNAWLQAKLCADADRMARLEARLKAEAPR